MIVRFANMNAFEKNGVTFFNFNEKRTLVFAIMAKTTFSLQLK
jgi:hypothetical protein